TSESIQLHLLRRDIRFQESVDGYRVRVSGSKVAKTGNCSRISPIMHSFRGIGEIGGRSLRNYKVVEMQRLPVLHHQSGSRIVVLTDIFEELDVGTPSKVKAAAPGFRIHGGVIDENLVLDGTEILARETFDC